MAVYDIKDDLETLRQWQLNKVQSFEKDPVQFKTGTCSVTILDYFFRPPETASYYFPFTECAILETWKHCGLMKTVLVVCEPTKPVVDFANRFPKWIEIQSEPSLHSRPPGEIESMSFDCITRLHTRFSTPYVLIIQDDGFPLRSGLEDFLGKADFIGAPMCRDIPIVRIANFFLRWWPSNGGFSLRTKRFCEKVANYWEKNQNEKNPLPLEAEDHFMTQTLVKKYPSWRYGVKIAPASIAARFSYELVVSPKWSNVLPFGFHSARAFSFLKSKFCF